MRAPNAPAVETARGLAGSLGLGPDRAAFVAAEERQQHADAEVEAL